MMTHSQTPVAKIIVSHISILVQSAQMSPKIRGIRYAKPQRLCDEHDTLSPVKKFKVLCSIHQSPSKPSPPTQPNDRKKYVPGVSSPKALSCVTPRSGDDVKDSNSYDDSYNHCLPHAWNTPQYGVIHTHYRATSRTLKQNP
jgi:hypothetical protein